MKIAIIGWYKHNNAGDERILYCLKKFFHQHEIFVFDAFEEALQLIDEVNKCDFVLIGGGSLILRNRNKYVELIDKIKPAMGCVGIGIEAYHQDNAEFINAIKEKSEFIIVRDERSQSFLNYDKKVICAPDLTFLYPAEIIEVSQNEICSLNLIKINFWKADKEVKSIFNDFMKIVNKFNKIFPLIENIYPLPKWQASKTVKSIKKNFSEIIPAPLYFENHNQNDYYALSEFFDNCPNRFSFDLYKNTKYSIAMRLHSIIFSCQMGIPFISLSYSPKNSEFCKSIEMSDFSIDIYNLSNLEAAAVKIKEDYSNIREKLLYYREKNQLEINQVMNNIAFHNIATPKFFKGAE